MSTTMTSPQRIVFAIGTPPPPSVGGAEGQLMRLAAHLQNRGHEVEVFLIGTSGPLSERIESMGIPVQVFGVFGPQTHRGKLPELLRLARVLRRTKPDVVYAWLPPNIWLMFPLAFLLTRAKRVAALRGFVSPHDVRIGVRRLAFWWSLRYAHAVAANAPWLLDDAVARGARPDRVHLMTNGVELPASVADPAPQPPRAVMVANFHAYKGQEILVEALARVPDLTVTFLGSGAKLDEVKARAKALGVADRALFVDDCTDVSPYLLNAQLAVHSSRTEGMPNAIIEEIAHGLPVVATDVGATSMIVEDGVNGYVVAPDDVATLADRLQRLCTDPELRVEFGKASLRRAQNFSWTQSVEQHENMFASI